MYVTQLKFYFRDQGDESVATPFAHPPEAMQGQSLQEINSGLNSDTKGRGELKWSAVFELPTPTEEETEADGEFTLQMLRRRRRKQMQMKEGDVSSVTTAEEGDTRKVSKRSISEGEDNSLTRKGGMLTLCRQGHLKGVGRG